MSIAGLAASSFFSGAIAQSTQAKFKQAQQEFQKLGQDLQAGNLAQAQTDLTALQKDFPGTQGAAPRGTGNDARVAQPGFQQLSHDLQAGNLAGARADFAALRQDLPQASGPPVRSHRHARHGDESSPGGIAEVLSQLGQALQSSNVSAAQQSYNTLLQEFQQTGSGSPNGDAAVTPGPISISI